MLSDLPTKSDIRRICYLGCFMTCFTVFLALFIAFGYYYGINKGFHKTDLVITSYYDPQPVDCDYVLNNNVCYEGSLFLTENEYFVCQLNVKTAYTKESLLDYMNSEYPLNSTIGVYVKSDECKTSIVDSNVLVIVSMVALFISIYCVICIKYNKKKDEPLLSDLDGIEVIDNMNGLDTLSPITDQNLSNQNNQNNQNQNNQNNQNQNIRKMTLEESKKLEDELDGKSAPEQTCKMYTTKSPTLSNTSTVSIDLRN